MRSALTDYFERQTVMKDGKAGHNALFRITVLRKSNRKFEVDYIVANWENWQVSS